MTTINNGSTPLAVEEEYVVLTHEAKLQEGDEYLTLSEIKKWHWKAVAYPVGPINKRFHYRRPIANATDETHAYVRANDLVQVGDEYWGITHPDSFGCCPEWLPLPSDRIGKMPGINNLVRRKIKKKKPVKTLTPDEEVLAKVGITVTRTALGQTVFIPTENTDLGHVKEGIYVDAWISDQLIAMGHYMKKHPECGVYSDGSGTPCK